MIKRSVGTLAVVLSAISFGAQAGAECSVSVDANDMMKFSTDSISVPSSCKEVTLTLNHTGKLAATSMGHNVVIADTANVQAVGTEGMSAGLANNYVKPDDPRVYAFTKIIGGGESTSVTFSTEKMKPGGDYTFFCSFPGHWAIMKGKFEFK
ncbi:azurin [Vibrio neptunius]|uniref:azurin n=1 Tax=Vibrio neptunius TaxID=170651 RepID=UPI0019D1BFAC|nr:azurin [Vibrio neptunius]MBN3574811.1 azurin [Vibrio neptunius]QXX08764.1 azurin [Vibrio neptunius]QXX08781.1 azurin [Vibrio neptunius]